MVLVARVVVGAARCGIIQEVGLFVAGINAHMLVEAILGRLSMSLLVLLLESNWNLVREELLRWYEVLFVNKLNNSYL